MPSSPSPAPATAASRLRVAAAVVAGSMLLGAWLPRVSTVGAVEGCAAGCAAPSSRPGEGSLRVVVLNVCHGFPFFSRLGDRLEGLGEQLEELRPDLVLLQEVPWTPWLGGVTERLARSAGLNYLSVRDNGNRHAILFETRVAVLSRFPLRSAAVVELGASGFFEHRVALTAVAETPEGPLPVVVTHLTNGSRQRNARQAEALRRLAGRWQGGPVLVGGDLNAGPESPQVRALAARWTDVFAAPETAAGATCCASDLRSGAASQLRRRVDYLFLVPGRGAPPVVRSARRLFTEPLDLRGRRERISDHAGLFAALELAARPRLAAADRGQPAARPAG